MCHHGVAANPQAINSTVAVARFGRSGRNVRQLSIAAFSSRGKVMALRGAVRRWSDRRNRAPRPQLRAFSRDHIVVTRANAYLDPFWFTTG
jgi:hypothetical protein